MQGGALPLSGVTPIGILEDGTMITVSPPVKPDPLEYTTTRQVRAVSDAVDDPVDTALPVPTIHLRSSLPFPLEIEVPTDAASRERSVSSTARSIDRCYHGEQLVPVSGRGGR